MGATKTSGVRASRTTVPSRRVLLGLLVLLGGCDGGVEGAAISSPRATPVNRCAAYPPPFSASYLPDGFGTRLRKGAGLFEGANGAGAGYPTNGLLGYYAGPVEVAHVNFETRPGPLPHEPAARRPVRVLGARGAIGKIEGGWSVEFSLRGCDYRMDAYGIDRAETVKVASGLRKASR